MNISVKTSELIAIIFDQYLPAQQQQPPFAPRPFEQTDYTVQAQIAAGLQAFMRCMDFFGIMMIITGNLNDDGSLG